jgi:4-amino-4-deoxy-L-arabinose transferase-like glycosyltransferase
MKKKLSTKTKEQPKRIVFNNWQQYQKYSVYIILLLTLGALIVRGYRVGFLSVWLDEYPHILPAIDVLKGNSITQGDSDLNGIFITWCVTLFFKLFGISETVARIPSIIFGSLSVPLVYYFGKKLYNRSIGITAATLMAFSLYAICWSRLARNYASFGIAYLILLIVIWLSFNSTYIKGKTTDFFSRNGLNKLYLIILPFAFLFSFINHQLTFFILFGLSVYILIKAISNIIKRKPKVYTNIYSILAYIIAIGTVILFTPALLDLIARPILGILLKERIVNWVLPDWDFIIKELKNPDHRFKSFMIYFNILKNDYSGIFYLGILGIISSFLIPNKRNEAAFMFSMFVVPFLLMSFIFREPATPNYLYYIYPLFFIYIGIFVYFVFNTILPLIFPKIISSPKWISSFSLFIIVIFLFISIPKKEIKRFINIKTHGLVLKRELFHSSFVNWKGLCKQVKPYIKKQDIVISTWQPAMIFYLDRPDAKWFRQKHYDVDQRKFVLKESTGTNNSAASLQDLANTFRNNETGWLFADYYFDNVLTDPRARDFVIRNMDYHFNFSQDGDIRVFSWDHKRPRKHQNSLLIEVGKNAKKLVSKELNFNLQNINLINKGIVLIIEAEGIDTQNEAYVTVNGNHSAFKVTKQNNSSRQIFNIFLQKDWLKQGENKMQFLYNTNIIDFPKGYVIYNISFLNQ